MKKQSEDKKEKRYFDIRVDALVPCSMTYRVLAENEEDALKQMDKKDPTSFKPKLIAKKLVKATVYEAGSLMIRLVKNYIR